MPEKLNTAQTEEQIFDRSIVMRDSDSSFQKFMQYLEAAGMSKYYELMPGDNDRIASIITGPLQNEIFGRSFIVPIKNESTEDLCLPRRIHESTEVIPALSLNPIIVVASQSIHGKIDGGDEAFKQRRLLLDGDEPGPHTVFKIEEHLKTARSRFFKLFK